MDFNYDQMKYAIFILALTLTTSVFAQTYGLYQAEVIRVVDGDTIELNVFVWPKLTQNIKLRLIGVNTPEKRGKNISECEEQAAQKATNFTQQFLKDVKTVTVSEVKLGKYAGRVLGKLSKGG